jgi:hypothetical protein
VKRIPDEAFEMHGMDVAPIGTFIAAYPHALFRLEDGEAWPDDATILESRSEGLLIRRQRG